MATEQIKSKIYRVLSDATNQVWDKISFWTKASDVEMSDGKTVEQKIGNSALISSVEDASAVQGVGNIPDALCIKELSENIDNIGIKVDTNGKLVWTDKDGADTVLNFSGGKNIDVLLMGREGSQTVNKNYNFTKDYGTVIFVGVSAAGPNHQYPGATIRANYNGLGTTVKYEQDIGVASYNSAEFGGLSCVTTVLILKDVKNRDYITYSCQWWNTYGGGNYVMMFGMY